MRTFLFILLIVLLTADLSSCKKWIDVKPESEVTQDELFSSEEGFNQAILGCYLQMGSGLYSDNLTMTVMSSMAQNYQASLSTHPMWSYATYAYTSATVKATIANIWANMYKTIGSVNNLLAHIDGAMPVFQMNHYNLVKGQALGLRAYLHFDLLRMFGPVPLNGSDSSSIPYMKTFGKEVIPASTAGEVMTLCLQDLDEAEKLLSVYQDIEYETGQNVDAFNSYTRNHFNYWAAKALKARICLYKGDKVNALKYAGEVISSGKFPFVSRSSLTAAANQNRTFSTEHVFALQIPLLKPIVDGWFRPENNLYQDYTLFLSPGNMNTLFDVSLGGASDYRYLYLNKNAGSYAYTTKFIQDGLTSTAIKNQMPMIRLSEMYYIAAEATDDLNEALTFINTIRTKRGLTALPSMTETSRIQEITREYTKEFYAEGQTFFFYKRRGVLPIPRATVGTSAKSYVFPLPDNEIEYGNR